jgi:hypothetical protein
MRSKVFHGRGWGTPSRMALPGGLVVGLALFIPLSYLMLVAHRPLSVWLLREDGVNEDFGAIMMLIGAGFAISAFRATRGGAHPEYQGVKRALILLLAFVLIFGAGEEVSWGQRIFGWGTPHDLAHANTQDETNLHDLRFFGGFLSISHLSQLFWLTLAVAIPGLAAFRPRLRARIERYVPILPLTLSFLFVVLYVSVKFVHGVFPTGSYHGPKTAHAQIIEIREMHVELLSSLALICVRLSLGPVRGPRGPRRRAQPAAAGDVPERDRPIPDREESAEPPAVSSG